jgi:hypothetical protein
MSQKMKRLEKKVKALGSVQPDKANLLAFKEEAEARLQETYELLEQIGMFEQQILQYVDNVEGAELSVAEHELINGSKFNVIVLNYDRTVIVSALGLIGKAKAHPNDDFSFELGYELALHRLMDQYLYVLCNQE